MIALKMSLLVITLCMVMSTLVICSEVRITTDEVVSQVEPYFISYAMDAFLLAQTPRWIQFDFKSTKLRTLMSGLAPAILRFGGSPADWTVFTDDITAQAHVNASGVNPLQSIFTHDDLDNMVNLTSATGNRFLFDLNLQLRFGSQWDPTNAIRMMQYMEKKNYGENVDFELGNEPEIYSSGNQIMIPAKRLGEDFVSLQHLVKSFPNLKQSMVVGPDVVINKVNSSAFEMIKSVVEQAGSGLKAATFHQYYFRGDLAHVKDYTDPAHFNSLPGVIDVVKKAVNSTSFPDTHIWIGETADAWHSGTVNVSDRFVSGFLWMDKLGVCARHGVRVVVRQSLYGQNYSLLDMNMDPNPDYWLSLMHKRLVDTRVLDVTSLSLPNTTRVYAHCSQSKYWPSLPKGSVTVFALNVHANLSDTIYVDMDNPHTQWVNGFLMTAPANDLVSKYVAVNGKTLKMVDDVTFPTVKPQLRDLALGINLPPLSFGFFVLPDAKAKACM